MTLTREDRIELVEDLLARMLERGLIFDPANQEAPEINVTCDGGTIECSHEPALQEDDVRRIVDDVAGRVVDEIQAHLAKYTFILRTTASS